MPTPYAGDDSDDDNAPRYVTFDLNDEDEAEGDEDDTMKDKVMRAATTYELASGYVHFKFLKWLKFNDADTD